MHPRLTIYSRNCGAPRPRRRRRHPRPREPPPTYPIYPSTAVTLGFVDDVISSARQSRNNISLSSRDYRLRSFVHGGGNRLPARATRRLVESTTTPRCRVPVCVCCALSPQSSRVPLSLVFILSFSHALTHTRSFYNPDQPQRPSRNLSRNLSSNLAYISPG